MLSNIWRAYGLSIDSANMVDKKLAGLTNYDIPDQMQLERPNVDGSPYSTITRLQSRDESISVTSLNVDDAIDIAGLGGQCVRGTSPNAGLWLWLARWDQCSQVPVVGNVHRRYGFGFSGAEMVNRAIIRMDSISCQHRGDATATLTVDVLADPQSANNFGITIASNIGLPGTLYDNQRRYTLGKMTVGGIEINNKTSFEITTNVNVERISVDSQIAAHYAHVSENKPVITIRGIDPGWNIPRSGLLCTHTDTILYLRRRGETSGNDFEPDNQAKHIKFTVKGKAFLSQLAGGSGTAPSETALMIYPEFEQESKMLPIVALTGQTIV